MAGTCVVSETDYSVTEIDYTVVRVYSSGFVKYNTDPVIYKMNIVIG